MKNIFKQSFESKGLPFQPKIIERDINGFSAYDAARLEKARRQLDEGRVSCHELIEA